jgi:hypothetical protein
LPWQFGSGVCRALGDGGIYTAQKDDDSKLVQPDFPKIKAELYKKLMELYEELDSLSHSSTNPNVMKQLRADRELLKRLRRRTSSRLWAFLGLSPKTELGRHKTVFTPNPK